jgi:uncharacterized protein with von Willebrand factor type A (vWA) domain
VDPDLQRRLTGVFLHLRQSGFSLGIGELLAALRAVERGWGAEGDESLKEVLRRLWCSSLIETRELEAAWLAAEQPRREERRSEPLPADAARPSGTADQAAPRPAPPEEPPSPAAAAPSLEALPIRAPTLPEVSADPAELTSYWPVSRRSMQYAWRYLRRPLPDGPRTVLDVRATIDQTARCGFFVGEVCRRQERNHAHLILLVDQKGSMTPFHRFTRDLVETAREESNLERVEAYYFYNVPADVLYHDPYLTDALPLEPVLAGCSPESSLLLVSDAGSARGHRSLARIQATTRFLARLNRRTTLRAWLNPMPQSRWDGSSAQFIAHLVPMFQMDPDGVSSAIDVARGQPLQAPR